MRVLLLGEFSGLHTNLKEGLVELGHEAIVAASRDGFKKIPVDISFESDFSGIIGKIQRRILPLISLSKMDKYDVVQLMNPFIFKLSYFPTLFFYEQIMKQNSKFFMLAAGCDAYYWRNGRKELKYGPFDSFLKYDHKSSDFFLQTDEAYKFNKAIVEMTRGVIPISYEYEVSYQIERKRLNTIPIPVNINKIEYTDNKVSKKLVIFHGLNRYGFKGTFLVEKAFDYLSKKYPNELELIIDGNMPLNEYLKVMKRTNVVIDQMYSHSIGVNGVFALAMGKVVMGGAEKNSLISLGTDSSPVINLQPSVQSIIDEVETLLEKREQIQELGFQSRLFAESIHSHTKVAQQYIDTWRNN